MNGVAEPGGHRLRSPAVKLIRTASLAFVAVTALGLAACGGETPAGAPSSAPSGPAPATSSLVTSAPPAATGGEAKSDKERCETAQKAGVKFKDDLLAGIKSGQAQTSASYQKYLEDFAGGLTEASGGGDSKVAKDLQVMGTELKKASAAADPAKAADGDALTKAASDVEAACKAAGAELKFGE